MQVTRNRNMFAQALVGHYTGQCQISMIKAYSVAEEMMRFDLERGDAELLGVMATMHAHSCSFRGFFRRLREVYLIL